VSGPTELILWPVTGISVLAAATDLWKGRIYNWMTLPALACGIAVSAVNGGAWGALSALAGAALGLALYGWMFWLGQLGGGDVKLLMALGAWGGPAYAADVALLSVLLGGALALGMPALRVRLPDFARKLFRFGRSVALPGLEVEIPRADRSQTLPFGVPIAVAAIWIIRSNPLELWGIRPW
jgi:prepilin peptidase CpaA